MAAAVCQTRKACGGCRWTHERTQGQVIWLRQGWERDQEELRNAGEGGEEFSDHWGAWVTIGRVDANIVVQHAVTARPATSDCGKPVAVHSHASSPWCHKATGKIVDMESGGLFFSTQKGAACAGGATLINWTISQLRRPTATAHHRHHVLRGGGCTTDRGRRGCQGS